MTTEATPPPRIQPKLSAFDTTMIVISLIIGAGIFRTPSEVALKAGSVEMFFGAWVLGGIIAILGALTFAELGARRPVAGGYYALVSHAYGTDVAFMLNWTVLIVSGVNLAAVTVVGVDYLAPLLIEAGLPISCSEGQQWVHESVSSRGTCLDLPAGTALSEDQIAQVVAQEGYVVAPTAPFDRRLVGVGLIGFLYVVNLRGIRVGALVQNILSALKVGLILVVASLALTTGDTDAVPPASAIVRDAPHETGLLLAMGASLVPVFFTFGGYQMITNVSADIRQPQRNIPRGVLIGVGIVFTLYLFINVAYIQTLGLGGVAASTKVAGDLAGVVFGPWGDRILSVMIFLSVLGFMNVAFLHMPRGYLAMAQDGVLPAIFGRVNAKTQVQDFALTFFVVSILISMMFLGEFGKMLDFVMFIDLLAMAILATTLFVLRHRGEGDDTPYQVPLYPWLPLLYTGVLLSVVMSVFIHDVFIYQRYHTLVSLGLLALGFPLSRLFQRGSKTLDHVS